MKCNKKIVAIILPVLVIIGYLWWANFYLYHRIGVANLKIVDMNHVYLINNSGSTVGQLKYSALGDSLTSGVGADSYEESYPYQVVNKIAHKENVQIILENFSFPGAKTNDLISNLLVPVITSQPDLVTVLIGTNDLHNFVSLDDFKKNYQTIIEELTKKTKAKVYLISIPVIGSDTTIFPPYNYYFNAQREKYNAIIKELAGIYKLKFIDITSPTADLFSKDGSHYAADSFHPSATGYELWSKIIYDGISE